MEPARPTRHPRMGNYQDACSAPEYQTKRERMQQIAMAPTPSKMAIMLRRSRV